MAQPVVLDLATLRMSSGEGRRLDLDVELDQIKLSGAKYDPDPAEVNVRLDISRMLSGGFALQLRFKAGLSGACMRCLQPTQAQVEIDLREQDQPGTAELRSPYVDGDKLDLGRWVNDAFVLEVPVQVVCKPECLGLCPECGADLNAEPDHQHLPEPDERLSGLAALRFDEDGKLRAD